MNKTALTPIFLLLLLASGCNQSDSLMDSLMNQVDYIPVRVSENDDWSFVTPEGKLIYEGEFKNSPSMVVNGIFSVEEKDGYTLYSAADKKKPQPLPKCEDLKYVGAALEGLIPITEKRERISVINTKGVKQFTLEPINGKEITECASFYWNGLLKIKTEDEKWGFVNQKGEIVIDPQFDYVGDFNNGVTVAMKVKNDKTYHSVINEAGKEVASIRKNLSIDDYTFNSGYIFAIDANSRYIAINEKGEEVLKCPSKVESIIDNNDKYFIYYSDGEIGVMNFAGESIIRPKYNSIQIISTDKFLATKGDKHIVINAKDDVEISIDDYNSVTYVQKFGFWGYDRNTVTMLDDQFKPVKGAEFESVDYATLAATGNYVYSDYINVNGLLEQMLGDVSFEGIGEYKLEMTPQKILKNPNDYLYSIDTSVGEELIEGKYTISEINLGFDDYIATNEYTDTYGLTSRFNPQAKLCFVGRNLQNVSEDLSSSVNIREEMIKYLENKGLNKIGTARRYDRVYDIFMKGNSVIAVLSGEVNGVIVTNNKEWINDMLDSIEGFTGHRQASSNEACDTVVDEAATEVYPYN